MADGSTFETARSLPLRRTLGVGDVTWLYVVAIFNLNIVPVVAAEGPGAIWLWGVAILCFFLPQAVAVLELAELLPGEGGLYLWSKETFGEFHGFLCGWCYWLTNMFFVPSLLFYVTGVTAYLGATSVAGLNENRLFFFLLTNVLLWVTILANVYGLGVGKWINNIGGIGSLIITAALVALALMNAGQGHHIGWSELTNPPSGVPLSTLGLLCMAMVGLEIGPVMGDEVRNPRQTFPRAILLGGGLCAIAYVVSTLSLVVAVPQAEMRVVQGMMQAIDRLSAGLTGTWLLLPLGVLTVASIVGSTSAWVSGSARILFVSGLDRYLPAAFGRIHSRYGSPYVALCVFGALASAIVTMSFIGVSVREAYVTMLDLSVALQMISYLYVFAALCRHAFSTAPISGYFPRWILRLASVVGTAMTVLAFAMVFVPSGQISSIWAFELKMVITLGVSLAAARALYLYYSQRKVAAGVNS
jgi:amino acid transporter